MFLEGAKEGICILKRRHTSSIIGFESLYKLIKCKRSEIFYAIVYSECLSIFIYIRNTENPISRFAWCENRERGSFSFLEGEFFSGAIRGIESIIELLKCLNFTTLDYLYNISIPYFFIKRLLCKNLSGFECAEKFSKCIKMYEFCS